MTTYLIRDGNQYLMWFSNNCAWFTQTRCEAVTFERLEEAKIVARTLSPLASDGLQILPAKYGKGPTLLSPG